MKALEWLGLGALVGGGTWLASRFAGKEEPTVSNFKPSGAKVGPPIKPGVETVANVTRSKFALHHGGYRPMVDVRLIVIHSAEGGSADGVAAWFADPRSTGSTHLAIDDKEVIRTLPDEVFPFGAPGVNREGLHVEMVGFAKWSRAEWLAHPRELERAAIAIRSWSDHYGIPLVFLDAAAIAKGAPRGVTTHHEATIAFSNGKGHWDPGPGFPMDVLIEKARALAPIDPSVDPSVA